MSLADSLALLRTTWDGVGATTARDLAPGAAPASVVDRIAAIGFVASDELVTWFTWQDGGVDGSVRIAVATLPFPLGAAVAERSALIDQADMLREETETPREYLWQPHWLPLFQLVHAAWIGAELTTEATDTSRIWHWEPEAPEPVVIADSMEEMIDGWVRLIEGGFWRWDPTRGHWQLGDVPPPEDLARFSM